MNGPVHVVLLAAGAGRRMGVTKGLVDFGGRPLLAHLLDEIRASPVDGAVVVLGSDAERVRPHAAGARTVVVVNPDWPAGQTGSLQRGLAALPPDAAAFLVLPVDHAWVGRSDLAALVARFRDPGTPEDAILRPVCGAHWGHPVLFPVAYLEEFRALGPDEPGHRVYRRHRDRVIAVPVRNPRIGRDADRPSDL